MTTNFILKPGDLTRADLRRVFYDPIKLSLHPDCLEGISASAAVVNAVIEKDESIYGINTGFGQLARKKITKEQLKKLQKNLVLSHATGTGYFLYDHIVRLVLFLKINALAQGYSGVRQKLIDALIALLNNGVYPCIPEKGSVGASGDLAPLAHLAAVLLGYGEVSINGKIFPAKKGLKKAGLSPMILAPKEGLALLNGTQVTTALALSGYFATENCFSAGLVAGAMSLEAAKGSPAPFREEIQKVRHQKGQIIVAQKYRELLKNSKIRESHFNCDRVQDPYSLRCIPQVMGACLDHIKFVGDIFEREANAVSDNPLVFSKTGEVLSGGNFHAEPVAMAADTLALAIAEIGSISERRIAMLIDSNISKLPPFLVNDSGLNSGFMIAHVTAAALVSENKQRAHPACVDTIPTSANQEDHVSMGTHAARRLLDMTDNTATVVGIELLAAAQGIEFHRPLKTSPSLEKAFELIRQHVPYYKEDRYFAPDIEAVKTLITRGEFMSYADGTL